MEILFELQNLMLNVLHVAWNYVEAYSLEIIVFLFVATFMLGFVSATK